MNEFNKQKLTIYKIYSVDKYTDLTEPEDAKYDSRTMTSELIYFVKGECDTYLGTTHIRDCPGSIRYLPKGDLGGDYLVKTKVKPSLCFDVYFDGDFYFDKPIGLYNNKKLEDKFFQLYDVWCKKEIGYYQKSMSIFYDILFSLQTNPNEYLSKTQKQYMKLAYDYIVKNYRSVDFNYKELCRTSGLEYAYFSELFKKAYNMTPIEFVTKMKIDYAKELLATGRYSVTCISQLCGFSDVFYFSKVFKKKTGFSPSKYSISF